MGGVLQDSLNEMGVKQAANSGGNPLQAIMGNPGGLQKAIQNEWNNQSRTSRTSVTTFATVSPHWKPSARIC